LLPSGIVAPVIVFAFDNCSSVTAAPVKFAQPRSAPLRLFIPRGLVIPGLQNNLPHYIKIRRPLPDDSLSEYLPLNENGRPKEGHSHSKVLSIRGGRPTLFGQDIWIGFGVLILTDGEWDCMLAWQHALDLCDVATLGSASNRATLPDLAATASASSPNSLLTHALEFAIKSSG